MYDYEKVNIDDDLAKIADTISNMLPQAKIYLFGSFTNGTPHEYSDIDLCVIVPALERNRFEMTSEIRDAIDDKTDYPIDLLLFSESEFEKSANKKWSVQYDIAREGVLLNA